MAEPIGMRIFGEMLRQVSTAALGIFLCANFRRWYRPADSSACFVNFNYIEIDKSIEFWRAIKST